MIDRKTAIREQIFNAIKCFWKEANLPGDAPDRWSCLSGNNIGYIKITPELHSGFDRIIGDNYIEINGNECFTNRPYISGSCFTTEAYSIKVKWIVEGRNNHTIFDVGEVILYVNCEDVKAVLEINQEHCTDTIIKIFTGNKND